jgi:hypothetical protein
MNPANEDASHGAIDRKRQNRACQQISAAALQALVHKMETEFNPEKGKVVFPSGAVTTLAASPAELHLNIDADSGETLDRLEQVVADHIKRFAFREELEFVWNRGA